VLLWLCARHGWDFVQNLKGRPQRNTFTGWYTGSYKEIANKKLGNIDKGKKKGLEVIIKEFPPLFDYIKSLYNVIRDVLFLYKDRLFIEISKDPEVLYRPIIEVFNKTIDDIITRGL
jgi:hypothetical protein